MATKRQADLEYNRVKVFALVNRKKSKNFKNGDFQICSLVKQYKALWKKSPYLVWKQSQNTGSQFSQKNVFRISFLKKKR